VTLTLIGHNRKFAVEQAVLNYFPKRDGGSAVVRLSESGRLASAMIEYNGKTARGRAWTQPGSSPDNALRFAFYRAAKQIVTPPPWGALTGVRPVKKALEIRGGGHNVAAELSRRYDVSPARAKMAADCAESAASLRERLKPGDFALYIGIPFCPTRCAYCSFVSSAVQKERRLTREYLDTLREEIELAGETVRELGLRLRSIYWGGGTPAILEPDGLSLLLCKLREVFALDGLWEHTFEAGRPDAVTAEKLQAAREGGVTRISVNPQALHQNVLDAIGRKHTPEQFFEAFELARKAGFSNINTDLIAGLPGDSRFLDSLENILALCPENITVHTLAKKRGSRVAQENMQVGSAPAVAEMLDGANGLLQNAGYNPYYLYRQKFTEGGFENTGWSKPGYECLYNLCMMEELCTVLSLGAGGVTKWVGGSRIERLFHCKYPLEYIQRRDIMKDNLSAFAELYRRPNR
jgi:oxygen-independent coproporphyrinogen-3 oxidase